VNLLDSVTSPVHVVVNETARARIHVVDDDCAVRGALVRLLVSMDYEVSAYPSGESFLAEHDPDVFGCIVLDVAMPGLSGLSLQRALAERGNRMPIIFLTGNADVPMCAQAMKSGAVDFLTKPIDERVLVSAAGARVGQGRRIPPGARISSAPIISVSRSRTPRLLVSRSRPCLEPRSTSTCG